MDLTSLSRGTKNVGRLKEIANVFAKHGLGSVIERLGLSSNITIRQRLGSQRLDETDPVRVRHILEELGPTFVKLGQLLSTREDLVGPAMVAELSKLQDNVPEFEFKEAKEIIEADLGKPLSELFSEFKSKPIASASIGEVFIAKLKDGRKVVVKVRRPNIEAKIDEDLSIMHYLAGLVQRYVPESRPYDPTGIVEEFDRAIHKELDCLLEAKNAQRFFDNFKGSQTVLIPKVYFDYCSSRVITMDYVDGVKLKDLPMSGGRFNRKLLARRLATAFFKMALVDGFFHADPHPSNVFALKGDKICFIDFGMVGRLEKSITEQLGGLFLALMRNDVDGMIDEMDALGIVEGYSDQAALRRDLSDLMDEYYDTQIQNIQVGEFMQKLTLLTSRHGAKLPRDYVLLSRGIAVVESSCRRLDPQFNSVEVFKPLVAQITKERNSPKHLLESLPGAAYQIGRLAKEIPTSLRSVMSRIESGKLQVEFEHKDMNIFTGEMERASNKLSLALILSALIVGSAMVIMTDRGATILGLSALGFAGFIISAVLAIWLVITILRFKQV